MTDKRIAALERDLAEANSLAHSRAMTIERLEKDLAAAQAERDTLKGELRAVEDRYAERVQERDEARAEAAALRVDAERYRWLRDRRNGNAVRYVETYIQPDGLDAAIDAARGGGK